MYEPLDVEVYKTSQFNEFDNILSAEFLSTCDSVLGTRKWKTGEKARRLKMQC